jgi:hypothetical protein
MLLVSTPRALFLPEQGVDILRPRLLLSDEAAITLISNMPCRTHLQVHVTVRHSCTLSIIA